MRGGDYGLNFFIRVGEWIVLLPVWRRFLKDRSWQIVAASGTGILWFILIVAISVASGGGDNEDSGDASPTVTPTPTMESTPTPTEEATPEPTAEPTPAPTPESTPEPTAAPTAAPTAPPTAAPTAAPTQQTENCDRQSYPDVCIPPYPPDLNCGDVPYTNFRVLPPDPHGFDGNGDGIGCEG